MLEKLKPILVAAWLPALFLVVAGIALHGSTSPYFPSLSLIWEAFLGLWSQEFILGSLMPSVGRILIGMAIAISAGVLLGLIIGSSQMLIDMLNPVLDFFRSLPKAALLPPLIVLMGVGDGMKIFIIAFGAFWPVLLNMIDGVRSVDHVALQTMRVYGITSSQKLFQVTLPAASPAAFIGVKVAFAIGLVMMVISEMVGSAEGLGGFVLLAQQTFSIANMWAGIILIGLLGYVFSFVLKIIEKYMLAWYYGWKKAGESN